MKMLNREEFNAYRFAKREADIEKRAMLLIEFLEKFPGTKLMEKIDLDTIKPLEDQHNAYDAAGKEVDGKKRAVLLIEFLQKYPRSALVQNVRHDYAAMMKDASLQKQYELLEFLSEHWLKVRPDDGAAYAFLAEASRGLQKYGRCGEIFETIYKMEPFPDIARETYLCYQKTENLAKNAEWAEELAKMPEFKEDYTLYFDLVMRYSQNNNVNKAAEYAERTLKAVDPDLQSDAKVKEQVRKVHRISHHIIASDLMERKNYTDAISAYKEALKDEKYGEGYYGIGLCLDNQKQIEDANLYYAMAELMGGESAPKAKARLETLYRALHNNTLVGLDKVYQKAKETLEAAAY
jgi:tetratricopeptide (TPR) repeat protein